MSTKQEIVIAADHLFYRQGFASTPFAKMAGAVGISRGNFYHHFKTKDEILSAVIAYRMENTRKMLKEWECVSADPVERICSFIRILLVNEDLIEEHGCPVGTLVNEMAKIEHQSFTGARKIFDLFREWLVRQFAALGAEKPDEQAMRILAFSQGMASVSTAYRDRDFIAREVERACNQVRREAATNFKETI